MGLFGPDFSKEKREKIDKLVITTIEDEEIKSCLSRSLLATSLLTLGSTYGMYRVTKGRTGLSKFFRIGATFFIVSSLGITLFPRLICSDSQLKRIKSSQHLIIDLKNEK